MSKKIVIGTRGSQLAVAQTNIIKEKLQTILPKASLEIKIITTAGDKNMMPVPLDSVGKGWFTKEIDKALLEGKIDMAVHSLKDLPEVLPEGLIIAAIPEREDAREAFVSKKNIHFEKLKKGAIIGTDSTRRKVQLLHKRPDLEIRSIRGNVNRRLEKLEKGEYDGIFLAVAGLKRIGLEDNITDYFFEDDIIPSPGQGALAVVIRKNNKSLFTSLEKLNHSETIQQVKAERSFSKIFGGGCTMPIGAYLKYQNNTCTLYGVVGSPDGKHMVKDSLTGAVSDTEKLAKQLAEKLLKKSYPWYVSNNTKYIVVTRPEKENKKFIQHLEKTGLQGFSYPTIMIDKLKLTTATKKYLYDLETFDWILFTSSNGVKFFLQALKEAKIDISVLKKIHIAAVGAKTAMFLEKQQLSVHFIPSQFTTEVLAKELKAIKGKRILMPQADIATPQLTVSLEKKGAIVVNMPIYKTTFITSSDNTFESLVKENKITCITFTSPSTVRGFIKNIEKMETRETILSFPVLAIGPVTTKSLEQHGFKNIYTARIFTEEGMLTKLQEIIL